MDESSFPSSGRIAPSLQMETHALRWSRTLLLFGCVALFCLPLGPSSEGAPQVDASAQGGNVQKPVRLCVINDFGNGKTDSNAAYAEHPLVQGPEGDDNFYGATPSGGTNNQ